VGAVCETNKNPLAPSPSQKKGGGAEYPDCLINCYFEERLCSEKYETKSVNIPMPHQFETYKETIHQNYNIRNTAVSITYGQVD